MNKKKVKFSQVRTEAIVFDGGLNESVSSLDLKPGELIDCINYQLTEGAEGGYVSVKGYERYDGQPAPSDIGADEQDSIAREARRSSILEVPGSGGILGVTVYKGLVYAFRNHTDGLTAKMWVESPTGWIEVSTPGVTFNPSGSHYHFYKYNFKASAGTEKLYWTDGVSKAHQFDGTTITPIDNTGMGVNDIPVNLATHNNRLFLAYKKGSLQYSNLADPLDWATGAGEIGLGHEVTDIVAGVGNALIIFCENSIKILNGQIPADWKLETFSSTSGSRKHTAVDMLGSIYFLGDRGLTSLEAVQAFGNFSANALSPRVKRLIQNNLNNVTSSVASQEYNQYRIFFSNGAALYFSFLNKEMKGVTQIRFPIAVRVIGEGKMPDGNSYSFFGSDTGYVYKMESGTSFDGIAIPTKMTTAFYHYKSPRNWKRFHRATFEIICGRAISLFFKPSFDYDIYQSPKSITLDVNILGVGVRWGEGKWGVMNYGGSNVTNRIGQPIEGVGSNMNFSIETNDMYASPHTIQNVIIDYTLMGRQL